MIDVIWDMETGDPDDYLTLLLLLGHPRVRLKAVCVTPGSPEQVGLVKQTLARFGVALPVGSTSYSDEWHTPSFQRAPRKTYISAWHNKVIDSIRPDFEAEVGWKIYHEHCDEDTTLITGGPVKNLGAAVKQSVTLGMSFRLGRWIAQGGFAGEGVVPEEKQLPKFRGMKTCPTWNLNGAIYAALDAIAYEGIGERRFVSKNVCHGVYYDKALHEQLAPYTDKSRSLKMIWKVMAGYLRKKPSGKKFHDPLAACCAIEPSIASWAEVELSYEKGRWGSSLSEGSGTWIITDLDRSAFFSVLSETELS